MPSALKLPVSFYANLEFHRSALLEGIRLIACRNLDHLNRAINAVGIQSLNEPQDLEKVQHHMLAEQGLEENSGNRSLLANITWFPWEAYLVLLYTELQGCAKFQAANPIPGTPPIADFLGHNEAAARPLNALRNKLLHPNAAPALTTARESFVAASAAVHGHHYRFVDIAQRLVDDFARHLQATLLAALCDAYGDLLDHVGSWHQGHEARRQMLNHALADVRRGVPHHPYDRTFSGAEKQTPPSPLFWHSFSPGLGLSPETLAADRAVFPDFACDAAPGCVDLLLRSRILANEFLVRLDIQKLAASENPSRHDPRRFMRPETAPKTLQQYLDAVAPVRVGFALVAEPLRIYCEATERNSRLKDGVIEGLLAEQDVAKMTSDFRNGVFHLSHAKGLEAADSRAARLHSDISAMVDDLPNRLLAFYLKASQQRRQRST